MLKAAKAIVTGVLLAGALALVGGPAAALGQMTFTAPGADSALAQALEAASRLRQAERDGRTSPQDLLAAARADYGQLLAALYAHGYYGGVIEIAFDGREAASIAPLATPATVGAVKITVRPGPRFGFASAVCRAVGNRDCASPRVCGGQARAFWRNCRCDQCGN